MRCSERMDMVIALWVRSSTKCSVPEECGPIRGELQQLMRSLDKYKRRLLVRLSKGLPSAELMPQFAEVATELKELGSDVVTAKVDVVRYPKAASNLGIKGYPTMLLFVNGSSKTNTGGFTLQEIVTWTSKKTGESVIRVNSDILAKEFLKKYSMIVVGLFENLEMNSMLKRTREPVDSDVINVDEDE
ncbi:hypothetical protein RHSIM_Rhsim10G0146000 [Rhododendron simsii]|uniref:Thioredoxin domain-containing protein n=1 Tax=Rhododendron simsii TaxID=118357 RepID=A0A834LB07_RHOSS|nr:hypothetical protein RHSIM_Rhsim10G0146000 [Rhododendron simsii]